MSLHEILTDGEGTEESRKTKKPPTKKGTTMFYLDVDDIFQARDQIECLHDAIDMEGGTIAHVTGDTVTINLPNGPYTEIHLGPIQRLLDILRKMDR